MSRDEPGREQIQEVRSGLDALIQTLSVLSHQIGQGDLEVDDSTRSLIRHCRQLCIEAAEVAANVDERWPA